MHGWKHECGVRAANQITHPPKPTSRHMAVPDPHLFADRRANTLRSIGRMA